MPSEQDHRAELRALSAEIARDRKLSPQAAWKLAAGMLGQLTKLARDWDQEAEARRPRRPPTA